MLWLLLSLVLFVDIFPVASFYLPGIAPIDYEKDEKLDVKVGYVEI